MNDGTLSALVSLAALIGFLHTLTGPDHYVPFVAMSRVGRWSAAKTLVITLACGVGHVLSSILLGALGIGLGLAVGRLESIEAARGGLAGWLLIGFGLAYLAWGLRRAIRNRPHAHRHVHTDGIAHSHSHGHKGDHTHVHADEAGADKMTPGILFTIFVFGPCEPLIPILMYPAAKLSLLGVVAVASVFGICTLATMATVVMAGYFGVSRLPMARWQRYSHALTGLAIAACGGAIQLGL